ncbi:Methylmalonyl-CoA mutase small subunit [Candidatus Terasakiella magnetica]|uniref:methylmalonyl-CoA mutase n=1 Tax=Candidatus Terasakiella magnetica TaxID=1867952 RepID=A0A1C3RLR6_9PROT|nr:methylmalonyl-CoA mutase family protein [Candidatus Terasakiella magnetica]SCA58178.1 Methylmalonyl-CoA mutase small subunit [Candidatus Terasakiella magnetica]
MSEERLALAAEFPATSVEAWKESLEKVLKGAPFEKKMVVKTYDGIDIQPLYTKDDWNAEGNPSGFPGSAPFTRGNTAAGRAVDGWDIRQVQANADKSAANDQILEDLERGVTSLILQFDEAARAGKNGADAPELAGRGGMMIYSKEDLADVLEGVLLDLAGVSLEAGGQAKVAADMLKGLWADKGIAPEQAMGAFNADPLGTLAANGSLPQSLEEALSDLASLAKETAKTYPHVTTVKVDTSAYYGAGATETQDLAIALATGVAYLRAMTDAGLSVDEAAKQIVFSFANSSDIFTGIAKLRAARFLWAQVVKASGGTDDAAAMNLHAATSARAMSKRDPWVNMLRVTATCFAGAVGGADAITVLPFDHHCGVADDFARRIARNTQIVLQEESSLNKVIDPAGGSWFIENLTEQYAAKAWEIFQGIEGKGGMTAVITDGSIQATIAETWDARLKNIAKRKDPITGVSEFPNILEETVERAEPDYAALIGKIAKSDAMIGSNAVSGVSATAEALPAHRLAEGFEKLRDAADSYAASKGNLPTIFSANIGAIAKHTGRASFAKNFFEAGGVQATQNNGFATADEAVAAFKETTCEVAVICGSDAQYEELAAGFAGALKAAGAKKVFLAGRGEFDGVDQAVGMGSDVLGTLQDLHTVLGV